MSINSTPLFTSATFPGTPDITLVNLFAWNDSMTDSFAPCASGKPGDADDHFRIRTATGKTDYVCLDQAQKYLAAANMWPLPKSWEAIKKKSVVPGHQQQFWDAVSTLSNYHDAPLSEQYDALDQLFLQWREIPHQNTSDALTMLTQALSAPDATVRGQVAYFLSDKLRDPRIQSVLIDAIHSRRSFQTAIGLVDSTTMVETLYAAKTPITTTTEAAIAMTMLRTLEFPNADIPLRRSEEPAMAFVAQLKKYGVRSPEGKAYLETLAGWIPMTQTLAWMGEGAPRAVSLNLCLSALDVLHDADPIRAQAFVTTPAIVAITQSWHDMMTQIRNAKGVQDDIIMDDAADAEKELSRQAAILNQFNTL